MAAIWDGRKGRSVFLWKEGDKVIRGARARKKSGVREFFLHAYQGFGDSVGKFLARIDSCSVLDFSSIYTDRLSDVITDLYRPTVRLYL